MYEPDNYLFEALEIVNAWDLPDEDFADAVNTQAKLMTGINPDDVWRCADDGAYPTH